MRAYDTTAVADSRLICGLTAYSMALSSEHIDDAIRIMMGFSEAINLLRFHPEILMQIESELDVSLIGLPDVKFQEYKAHVLAEILGFDMDPTLVESSKRELRKVKESRRT